MADERSEDPDVLDVMRGLDSRGHQGRALLLAVRIGMSAMALVVAVGVPPLFVPFLLRGQSPRISNP